jgi:hypothetical protein
MTRSRMPVAMLTTMATTILILATVIATLTPANAQGGKARPGPHKPSPTASTSPSPTASATPTASPTATGSPTPTASATPTQTSTPSGIAVPTSIAADCSVDVAPALTSWIASVPDGSTLLFGSGRCYRVESTIELRGRRGLTFEGNGATFRSINPMTSGAYTDDQRAVWRVIASTGFTFTNMTVTGAYAKGGTFDAGLQHAHGFDLRGTTATLSAVTVSNVAGDCFYFGLGYDGVTRSSGSVRESSCSSTGRNGFAASAANNVSVSDVAFDKIGFTVVDLEPNVGTFTASTGWGTSNVSAAGNSIGSYFLYAFAVVENAPNTDDSFVNNSVTGSRGLRVGVVAPGGSVRPATVVISGNVATVSTSTWSPAMEIHNVDGLTVTNNVVPIGYGPMATVDKSCNVNVSGNSYPGGNAQSTVTSPTC